MTPRTVSFQALKARVTALGQHAAGHPPAPRLEPLTPVVRGWAHDHRQVIGGEPCAPLDTCIGRRRERWAQRCHPHTTGSWIAKRDLAHRPGEPWRGTAPPPGTRIIRVRAVVPPPRHVTVTGDAHPVAPAWEASVQGRDRQLALQASSGFRAKVLRPHHGRCPGCRQVIPGEEALARPHRDGDPPHHRGMHCALRHPTGHRQVHQAPDRTTDVPRS